MGCFDSIAIETCVNRDGDWERTFRNLVTLNAKLIRENGTLTPERIRQHNHWSGKNCPERIRREGRWEELLSRVRADLAGGVPSPEPEPEFPGLPEWLPAAHFRAAFPKADPSGIVTRAVIAWMATTGRLAIYREDRQIEPGKSLWLFDGVTFLHDGGRVWQEGQAP